MVPPPISFHTLIASAGTKDGARARFQQLIAQLVRLHNPTVRQVQPRLGDWGIDCFVGELNSVVVVWQAKFFIDGVGAAQQSEIRSAFATAVAKAKEEGHTLTAWTLCIPTSLDPKATKWWDNWKRKSENATGVVISLWDETQLEGLILSPDARSVREAYFGGPAQNKPELRTHPLPQELTYDEMLFMQQLRAGNISETDSAKRQFFNAEIMRREVADKGIEDELREVEACMAEVHAVWETRFNEKCDETREGEPLPGLYSAVMKAIEGIHISQMARRSLPMGLVHRLGTMHHVVEEGQAGWSRGYRLIVAAHKRSQEMET